MLPSRKDLTLTRIVEGLVEGELGNTDEYLYFDPKSSRTGGGGGGGSRTSRMNRPGSSGNSNIQGSGEGDIIVFVVGGGGYLEYQNLLDWAQVNHLY